ncbi:HNH endonuclease [Streptomyces sp. NPDC006798]|uniref:HNH endonuclease n=1 Tax=Streptomyces sp. NPDC006798 TaxID=3155462 RepID=UPI003410A77A
MTDHRVRGTTAVAAALVLVVVVVVVVAPLLLTSPAATAAPLAPSSSDQVYQLEDAISLLVEADEDRTGYADTAFPRWNQGLDPADGCTTREEVLIAEAVEQPAVSRGCALRGGRWVSPYDNQSATDLQALAVAHAVPLAEAWGSGAKAWTAERREAYANDQAAYPSLNVVTARTVRERAEADIAGWLPPHPDAVCRYIGDWVATKLRWGLTVDKNENEVLKLFADNSCETTGVIRRLASV